MLKSDIPAAYVIVQHMPAGFTRSLSERLNATSNLYVKEAAPGDQLEVGKVLLAPGGFHMQFDDSVRVTLNQNPTVHGVRPAVDVTLLSIAQHFGERVVAAILTGMGSDGTTGALLVHNSGGWVISEAEESCVVYGMPRSVFEAGASNEVVPLLSVADAIRTAVGK
jgi:two-component system chemotaxis response regulator CheB